MYSLGALGLALLGCTMPAGLNPADEADRTSDPVEELPGVEGEDGPEDGGPDPVSDPLFDFTRVHEVHVELSAEAQAALSSAPVEYIQATVALDGERLEDVGVRLKGSNSFRPLGEKPSFKIKLDAFVGDQSFGRLRGVTLNNMIEDPTLAREILTYWLWNDAGVFASRASYTQVWVNDTYYGLYLLLESADRAWVRRRFTDSTGDLWEGEDDADFTAAGLPFFDRKCGEGNVGRLEAIAEALATPTEDYYALADQYFQMDQVLDYLAWSHVSANLDGYPFTLNDYIVYADPAHGGRLTMSPWGMDETWNPAFEFQWGVGVALFNCAADKSCMDRIKTRIEVALTHYDSADVPGRLETFYALSESAIAADTKLEWTPLEIAAARAELLTFTEEWPGVLRSQVGE